MRREGLASRKERFDGIDVIPEVIRTHERAMLNLCRLLGRSERGPRVAKLAARLLMLTLMFEVGEVESWCRVD
jgi:hypothetical protein